MTEYSSHGPVDIRVPPDPAFSRVLRLAASGIASLTSFTVDEIEDIKVAVSEVLLALIEHGAGDVIEIRMTSDEDSFVIDAITAVEGFDTEHPDLQMCRTVLSGVCSTHRVEVTDEQARIHATVSHADLSLGVPATIE